jgi:hypothetical protein
MSATIVPSGSGHGALPAEAFAGGRHGGSCQQACWLFGPLATLGHTTKAHGRLMLTVLGGLAERTRTPLPGTARAACIGS